MADTFLRVNNVKKYFGGVKALDGVSLEIKKGEIRCLAGENGCGKSTIINVISGFYEPDDGTIEIEGQVYNKLTTKQSILSGIQVIYQDLSLFPNLTVMENLALNNEVASGKKFVNKARMREIAEAALAKIDFKIDLDELVENLPVGTRQMIAICRALLNNAKLIIMDEPTTSLTKKEVRSLFQVIKDLQKRGIAILFVSHKLDEVFEIAETFTIFRNGKHIISGDTSSLKPADFTYYMTGRNIETTPYEFNAAEVKPILEVENISLENGFSEVSFAIKPGEIVGITGLMGSGRTELAEAIFGYHQIQNGKVILDGQELKINSIKDAIKVGIGYVPSDRVKEGLFLSQSITDNISIKRWDDHAKFLGLLNHEKNQNLTQSWIEKFSIATKNMFNAVGTLSGGNQQKCVLAKWLALDLKVLILNGPTVGVDIGAKFDIYNILQDLAQKGLAIIVISDDLAEVLANCNRVMVMKQGRLIEDVQTRDLDEQKLAALAV